jgi:cytochrome P450
MSERAQTEGVAMAQLMSPELARHPQPTYRALQQDAPVLLVDGVGHVVTARAGVDEVLRNPEVFSSAVEAHDLKARRPLIPLQIDPPAHRKYRKILDPLFAPQRMKLLEEPVAGLVNDLIDAFGVDREAAGGNGGGGGEVEIDFVQQFSLPFPSQVFLTLFGLPLDELPRFLAMKDGVIRPDHVVGHEFGHPDTEAHQQATADSIYAYFEDVLDERAGVDADAGGQERTDLLSHLLHVEVDGDRLTREEMLDICFLLLIAGLDTVSASLDCFFAHLAVDATARHRLVDEPDAIPAVVEELLRWETPVMAVARVATRDVEVSGCPIAAGDHVMAIIGAANVDDTEVADAGELRWDRDANRHLAFGGGVHRCLGSHLARLELRVALREWHRRIPDYAVKAGVELDFTAGIRTLATFPLVLG